jgi:peptidoglycan/LPS O-acetylase OafA/YrhL
MWSLHVEEQFYLVLPLLVMFLKREHLKRVLIASVFIAPVIRVALDWSLPDHTLLQYMLFPCRMDSLALGGLLAMGQLDGQLDHETLKRWRWPLVATTVCVLAVAVQVFRLGGTNFDGHLERTIGYTLFDVGFLGFIMSVLSLRGTAATAWLNWRPLQFVGMISYGFYLFQFPAEGVVNRAARMMGMSAEALEGSVAKFVAVGAVCLVLSTISWYLWETKWLAMQHRFRGKQLALPSTPTVVVVEAAAEN